MKRLFVMAVLAVAPVAAAEDDPTANSNPGEGNVRYQKTTTYDFEGDTVEGDLMKPDGEYVDVHKKVKHSNLIRVREHFREKVLQSVGEL